MTGHIFAKWLQDWDRKLRAEGRNILLLLDNCTAHPKEVLPTVLDMEDLKSFPPKTLTQILTLLKMFPFPAT